MYERAYRERYELDALLAHEQREIAHRFGERVSFLRDPRSVLKFGANEDIDTSDEEEVWEAGGIETLPTDNTISGISSDNAADTAVEVVVEGYRLEGGVFVPHSETVTLNGQNVVSFAQPFARTEQSFTSNGVAHVGTVYVHEGNATAGVPPVGEEHIEQRPADQQSQKAAITVGDADYFALMGVEASIGRNGNAARVDIKIKMKGLNLIERTIYEFGIVAGQGAISLPFTSGIIIQPNTDIRLTAIASQNNTPVRASFNGYYARRYS